MKGRVPANLAPLPRCSPVPLGWLVVGQIRQRLGVGPTSQSILSELQASSVGSHASQKGSKTSSKRGAPEKTSVGAKRSL